MIVGVAQVPEALGDRRQARPLRLPIERVIRVGPVDDLTEQHQGRIAGQTVHLQDGLERAFLTMMPQLDPGNVERDAPQAARFLEDLLGRDEEELGLGVDEFNQSATGKRRGQP